MITLSDFLLILMFLIIVVLQIRLLFVAEKALVYTVEFFEKLQRATFKGSGDDDN